MSDAAKTAMYAIRAISSADGSDYFGQGTSYVTTVLKDDGSSEVLVDVTYDRASKFSSADQAILNAVLLEQVIRVSASAQSANLTFRIDIMDVAPAAESI